MKAGQLALINAMEAERIKHQLGHKKFSTLLEITDSYWCMIRKGRRRPSLNLCQRIHKQFPGVGTYVDAYIRQGNGD